MQWLLSNWRELLPEPWAEIALAVVSVACGCIAGSERQRKEKPAGLRTLTLVSLGATVFTMVSYANAKGDPARIAAQIITGVGFLGAGAILHGSSGVTGMTTAATIWIMAAVGMVVGVGYAGAGLGLSVLSLMILTVISRWEKGRPGHCGSSPVELVFDPVGGKTQIKVEEILDNSFVLHAPKDFTTLPSGLVQLKVNYCAVHHRHRDFLNALAAMPEVKEIRRGSSEN